MSTFATVIIPASEQQAAQLELPGCFTAAYTSDPSGLEPATHYVSSGWFDTEPLEQVCTGVAWQRVIKFGDPHTALVAMGLQAVHDPIHEPEVVPEPVVEPSPEPQPMDWMLEPSV